LKKDKNAAYDDRVYYIPYLSRYFSDLESAYANVSRSLSRSCEAFIVVVNNTFRGEVVPLAEIVMDIWSSLGFSAAIAKVQEGFHVGTMNPRARGIRARHTEYTIRVTR
jgi:hypothetical protein